MRAPQHGFSASDVFHSTIRARTTAETRGVRRTRENFSFPIPAKPEPDKFNYNFAMLLNQFIEFGTRSTNRDGPFETFDLPLQLKVSKFKATVTIQFKIVEYYYSCILIFPLNRISITYMKLTMLLSGA